MVQNFVEHKEKIDKASRLSIRIVIWILSSDTETSAVTLFSFSWGPSKILQPLSEGHGSRLSICQLNQNINNK